MGPAEPSSGPLFSSPRARCLRIRHVSAGGYLCRPRPTRRKARRPAGADTDKVRNCRQPENGEGTPPHLPAHVARPRRRSDRMSGAPAWPPTLLLLLPRPVARVLARGPMGSHTLVRRRGQWAHGHWCRRGANVQFRHSANLSPDVGYYHVCDVPLCKLSNLPHSHLGVDFDRQPVVAPDEGESLPPRQSGPQCLEHGAS